MQLQQLELRRIELDLVTPFRTSFGVEDRRDILLLHVSTDEGGGWGECVAIERTGVLGRVRERCTTRDRRTPLAGPQR